jgi:hypothetical protein
MRDRCICESVHYTVCLYVPQTSILTFFICTQNYTFTKMVEDYIGFSLPICFSTYILSSTVIRIGTLPPPSPAAAGECVPPLWFRETHKYTGFIRGILRGVRYAKSLRVLSSHRRSPSWTTLVLYSRLVFFFNEPTNRGWGGGGGEGPNSDEGTVQVPIKVRGNCNNWDQVTIFK